MKIYNVTIKGIADLMQHRFIGEDIGSITAPTGQDHSKEWKNSLYLMENGQVYQPETHLHGALIKAGTTERIPGRRGKTYKDVILSNIFIEPAFILHQGFLKDFENVPFMQGPAPEDFPHSVYIDKRPVRIQKARVIRYRPAFVKGWTLSFAISCIDDNVRAEVIHKLLDTAGRTIGIGDYRPRFGRFIITKFEETV